MAASAAEIKKLEPKREPPDGLKPVPLDYLYVPYHFGNSVSKVIQVGSSFSDGHKVSGHVISLTQYPGFVVAEIRQGWAPGKLERDQAYETVYLTITGGHGKVAT